MNLPAWIAGATLSIFLPVFPYSEQTVLYHKEGKKDFPATLFLPDSGTNFPAVVMIHEGGFKRGSRHCFIPWGIHYSKRGYAVFSIYYRLLQEGGAYPTALKDCIQALRWLKANALQYKIDKNKIALVGSSAGAYLATMTALSTGFPKHIHRGHGAFPGENNDVAAVISSFGVYDWEQVNWYGGGFISRKQKAETSPISYYKQAKSPFLILSGGRDRLFPKDQAIRFADSLKALGVRVELHIFPKQGHGGLCDYKGEVARSARPLMDSFLESVFYQKE